ncbi:hypothetical protein G6011_07763 [Alternaria panax]|uniref:Uncharacterized protein n=1 Tax=Alternaria panax TaxID=48097 RepID=A0AAD4I770_9PLEO|nr:hypothetical protein G6011_07763 [Alternaria panax]
MLEQRVQRTVSTAAYDTAEAIREVKIPSYVTKICFAIEDEHLVPELSEELKSNYSVVTIVTPGLLNKKEKAQEAPTREKLHGIMQMIVELDETETNRNQELESSLRKIYPWAVIESKPGPNIPKKRARRTTESDVATPHRPDPVKHIEEFAACVMEPPSDGEFGYKYPIGEGWEHLSYPRKFEIAHA